MPFRIIVAREAEGGILVSGRPRKAYLGPEGHWSILVPTCRVFKVTARRRNGVKSCWAMVQRNPGQKRGFMHSKKSARNQASKEVRWHLPPTCSRETLLEFGKWKLFWNRLGGERGGGQLESEHCDRIGGTTSPPE